MVRSLPDAIADRLPRAAVLVAEHGFENARIEDLAAAMGISQSTLYYYFDGKEGILSYLLTDWLKKVIETTRTAIEGGGTGRERLERVIHAQFELIHSNTAACQVLLQERGRVGRTPDIDAAFRAAFHAPVAEVLRDGVHDGSLAEVNVEVAAAAVWGAVAATGNLLPHGPGEPESAATMLIDILFGGLGQRQVTLRGQ